MIIKIGETNIKDIHGQVVMSYQGIDQCTHAVIRTGDDYYHYVETTASGIICHDKCTRKRRKRPPAPPFASSASWSASSTASRSRVSETRGRERPTPAAD